MLLNIIILTGGEAYSQHHGDENEAGSKVHPREGPEKKSGWAFGIARNCGAEKCMF